MGSPWALQGLWAEKTIPSMSVHQLNELAAVLDQVGFDKHKGLQIFVLLSSGWCITLTLRQCRS